MSSIFDTLDFASDFFGQPDRNKQNYHEENIERGTLITTINHWMLQALN